MEVVTDLSEAGRTILGKDFYPLDGVKQVFTTQPRNTGRSLSLLELELEQAGKRGEFLIHRTDKASDGTPLTIFRMVQLLQEKFNEQSWGKILYDTRWYHDEYFFMADTPRSGPALVSKAPVPGSIGKNCWRQTEGLANLLRQIYQGMEMPDLYKDALREWASEKEWLEKILFSNWKGATRGLAELQINQQLRQKPVEVLHGLLVSFLSSGERRLVNAYTLTNTLASDGPSRPSWLLQSRWRLCLQV